MGFKVAVDTGGTFTDVVVYDEKGRLNLFKAPTTPAKVTEGIFDCISTAAEFYHLPLSKFLEATDNLMHGTTVATNAVLTGAVAKVGIICTAGFRDILLTRTGGKPPGTMFKHMNYPEPYIPRYRTLGVKERINADGEIEIPLDEDDVRAAIRQFKKWKVEAIAVCLLWSIVNPVHEKRVGEIIREEWPEVYCSISHIVNPVIREYYRTSTTAIDASLKPALSEYLGELEDQLAENRYTKGLLMVNSNAGVMTSRQMADFPVYAVKSGPCTGPAAALALIEAEGLPNNIILGDMGGTSYDISVITGGTILSTTISTISDYHYSNPSVDVVTIGAGGGSICWLDSGGLVHVGPQSAGSLPGPACYMKGGKELTVTDVDVVLGYINPDYFLGGRMRIYPELSEKLIKEKISAHLGIGVTEAANLVYTVVNQNMVSSIEEVTIRRGIDCREYIMIACGGAGAIHGAYIARELGINKVLISKLAAGLCAFGALASNLKIERVQSCITLTDDFNYERVNNVLEALAKDADAFLMKAGVTQDKRKIEFILQARYPYQAWEIDVSLPWRRITPEVLPKLVDLFNEAHQANYGYHEEGSTVECVNWMVRATGLMPKISLPDVPFATEDISSAIKGKRKVCFGKDIIETPIYDGSKLGRDHKILGPAIIEEAMTNIVVPEDFGVKMTRKGNYLMEKRQG
ncbi:MAG: hydantoinase/oxoprolinase family protein [Deltaproteobacteria bacterium]|nr:hydantoinase/oxoprolinase family protein [Deltaproteobacteria bacterium]